MNLIGTIEDEHFVLCSLHAFLIHVREDEPMPTMNSGLKRMKSTHSSYGQRILFRELRSQ